ncbi:unnamed protein product [Boreogadus saida]
MTDAEVEVGPRLVVAPGLEGFVSANQRPMDQGDISSGGEPSLKGRIVHEAVTTCSTLLKSRPEYRPREKAPRAGPSTGPERRPPEQARVQAPREGPQSRPEYRPREKAPRAGLSTGPERRPPEQARVQAPREGPQRRPPEQAPRAASISEHGGGGLMAGLSSLTWPESEGWLRESKACPEVNQKCLAARHIHIDNSLTAMWPSPPLLRHSVSVPGHHLALLISTTPDAHPVGVCTRMHRGPPLSWFHGSPLLLEPAYSAAFQREGFQGPADDDPLKLLIERIRVVCAGPSVPPPSLQAAVIHL